MKKLLRKNFFKTLGTGFAGFVLLNSFPVKLFGRNSKKEMKKIKVEINPFAVKRNKPGEM